MSMADMKAAPSKTSYWKLPLFFHGKILLNKLCLILKQNALCRYWQKYSEFPLKGRAPADFGHHLILSAYNLVIFFSSLSKLKQGLGVFKTIRAARKDYYNGHIACQSATTSL